MFKEQVRENFDSIFTPEVKKLLAVGINRGIGIIRDNQNAQRERLGYYALNSETRDVFSALCKGMEEVLDQEKTLVLQYSHQRSTSSFYIEIFNANLILHIRKATSDELPKYVKERCKMNTSFEIGKRNYGVLEYTRNGENLDFQIVIYDMYGTAVFSTNFPLSFFQAQIA